MQPDALFVDCYGTLVAGDEAVIGRVVDATARRFGVGHQRLDQAWWRRFRKLCQQRTGAGYRSQRELEVDAMIDALAGFGVAATPGEITGLLQPLFHYWRAAEPFGDAIEFLRGWTACPVVVVSNIDRADLDGVLPSLPMVSGVVTSEDARAYKPDAAVFGHALAATGLHADQVVHIGDSWESDVRGALAAGVRAVWLDRSGAGPGTGPAGQPRITTFAELPGCVEALH